MSEQPSPPDVDLSTAERLIGEAWPNLRGQPITKLSAGWDHSVFGGAGLVFRFPRNRVSAASLQLEQAIMPWIAAAVPTAVPVPVLITSASWQWPFGVHNFIPGIMLGDVPIEEIDASDLAPRLANFVKALHALDPTRAPAKLPVDDLARLDPLKRDRQTRRQIFSWQRDGLLSVEVCRALFQALDDWPGPPSMAPETLSVIHADLHVRNLLVTPDGRLSGVIDWVDVHHGHREIDLAAAWEVLPTRQAREAFFATYGDVSTDMFKRAKWRAVDHATRAFAGSIDRRDDAFARANRRALIGMASD